MQLLHRSQYGNGAVLDGGLLSLSKIGRIPVRLHRPMSGTPKTVSIAREPDGWHVCFSCAKVPIEALPRTGEDTGIDVGLKVFLSPPTARVWRTRATTARRKSSLPRPNGV